MVFKEAMCGTQRNKDNRKDNQGENFFDLKSFMYSYLSCLVEFNNMNMKIEIDILNIQTSNSMFQIVC